MKRWLLFLAPLLVASPAQAVRIPYAWDFPSADHPGVRFTLRVTGTRNNQTIVQSVPINPYTQDACRARHQACPSPIPGVTATPTGCTYTAETLCADVCLDPGRWTLEVYAHDGGLFQGPTFVSTAPPLAPSALCTDDIHSVPWYCRHQTCENAPYCVNCPIDDYVPSVPLCPDAGGGGGVGGPSNPLDVAIEDWVPPGDCPVGTPPPAPLPPNPPPPPEPTPVPIPPPIPPPSPPPSEETPRDPWSLVNLQCVHWRVLGPCFCDPYTPCTSVEYWEPAYLIETVKIPGDTGLIGFVSSLTSLLPTARLGGGGAANASSGQGHTNLHYNEVHVFKFPQVLGGPCRQGHSDTTLYYASEIDLPMWRVATGLRSPLPAPDPLSDIGVWAKLYPRRGKVIHGSEPVASGVAAVRGLDIALNPVGLAVPPDAHIVLQKADQPSTCCQLAAPKQTYCMRPGTNPIRWEGGTGSRTGKYIWIFWVKRTCCTQQVTSGITIVGGYGMNQCELQPPAPPAQ